MTELSRVLVPVPPATPLDHSHTSLQQVPWEICGDTVFWETCPRQLRSQGNGREVGGGRGQVALVPSLSQAFLVSLRSELRASSVGSLRGACLDPQRGGGGSRAPPPFPHRRPPLLRLATPSWGPRPASFHPLQEAFSACSALNDLYVLRNPNLRPRVSNERPSHVLDLTCTAFSKILI